jgi:DNA-binding transcriptional LysR family regulator
MAQPLVAAGHDEVVVERAGRGRQRPLPGDGAITVSLVDAEPPEALALLSSGEIDIAVAFGYPEAELVSTGDLEVVPLLEDELYLCLPRSTRCALRRQRHCGESPPSGRGPCGQRSGTPSSVPGGAISWTSS